MVEQILGKRARQIVGEQSRPGDETRSVHLSSLYGSAWHNDVLGDRRGQVYIEGSVERGHAALIGAMLEKRAPLDVGGARRKCKGSTWW